MGKNILKTDTSLLTGSLKFHANKKQWHTMNLNKMIDRCYKNKVLISLFAKREKILK